MAILESLATFIISLLCLGGCYGINRTFYEQEDEIERLENACPPEYEEESDPAPPYEDENTPILPPPTDQCPN
jgi:hypothetical protein